MAVRETSEGGAGEGETQGSGEGAAEAARRRLGERARHPGVTRGELGNLGWPKMTAHTVLI